MKIGVFDSGVGGESVANAIRTALPAAEIVIRDDRANIPYGNKTKAELLELVRPILSQMAEDGCDAIVIACNTVTTTIIDELRNETDVPLLGIEPMIRPAAALSQSGIIAVCATPATLASERYQWLKATYCDAVTVIEPDCSDWAMMVQENRINEQEIKQRIESACDEGADVIVLGCTHYHWIEEDIRQIADQRAVVIQPEQPIIARLKQVLGLHS